MDIVGENWCWSPLRLKGWKPYPSSNSGGWWRVLQILYREMMMSNPLPFLFTIADRKVCIPCLLTNGTPLTYGTYNHGQKTWDIFASLGCFPIHAGPTAPLTPQTMLNACIQNIFRVLTLYRVGGRETCKKISKRMHCFKREPRNDRKIWILQYCHKNFCPGL